MQLDDFEKYHSAYIRSNLVEYACYWNFPSEYDEDNYIILRIMSALSPQITYEHGHLNGERIKRKQMEWQQNFKHYSNKNTVILRK